MGQSIVGILAVTVVAMALTGCTEEQSKERQLASCQLDAEAFYKGDKRLSLDQIMEGETNRTILCMKVAGYDFNPEICYPRPAEYHAKVASPDCYRTDNWLDEMVYELTPDKLRRGPGSPR